MKTLKLTKLIFVINILILGCSDDSNEKMDWWKFSDINLPDGVSAYTINFIDNNNGFIGCEADDTSNYLYKTSDGGYSWEKKPLELIDYTFDPEYVDIYDIFFIDDKTGFITTHHLSNFKTIDGGTTWNLINDLKMAGQMKIYFRNEQSGFAFSTTSEDLAISNDAGNSWNEVADGFSNIIFDGAIQKICFPEENNDIGYLFENFNNKIFKTENGGTTWTQISSLPTDKVFKDMQFTSATNGYALTWNSLYKTTNSATSWEIINNEIGGTKMLIDSNGDIYVLNQGYVSFSTDEGLNFIELTIDNYENLIRDFILLDTGIGIAIDSDGTVLKFEK